MLISRTRNMMYVIRYGEKEAINTGIIGKPTFAQQDVKNLQKEYGHYICMGGAGNQDAHMQVDFARA